MAWYSKYIDLYEKELKVIPEDTIAEIRLNLAKIQSNDPVVAVSVIAYNEEKHLLSCLWSLSEMKCKYPVEIIGVNNDSKDRTEEIFQRLNLPYYNEMQHSCGYARRCGLEHAKGKYHINIDADTMYPPKYVETMVKALEKPGVVAVSSLWSYVPDKEHSTIGLFFYELLRDVYLFLQSFKRPELSVRGLVFAYHTDLARKVGIRVDIKRGEDGSLALGLKEYGKICFVRTRKARAVTGYGTVSADGSLLKSFTKRLIKACRGLGGLFKKKEDYKDQDDNLINKNT